MRVGEQEMRERVRGNKDWTVDTDDMNRNFIAYKNGDRKFVGEDWNIICFLHKQVDDLLSSLDNPLTDK